MSTIFTEQVGQGGVEAMSAFFIRQKVGAKTERFEEQFCCSLARGLSTNLKIRQCGRTQTRRKTLRQGEAAEQQSGIDGIACEHVPEKRHTGKVARREAAGSAWVAVQKNPHPEVSDNEKLQSAQEGCSSDAQKIAFLIQEAADTHAEEKTGIDQWTELVEADDEVGGKHHDHGKDEGNAAAAHHGAGKQSDRADWSEVPGMRGETQGSSDYDHCEDENGPEHEIIFVRAIDFHFVSPLDEL
jgi:hypothetical protein